MNGTSLNRAALVWGTLFTLTGAAYLAQEWGVWRVRPDVFLPLLLIVAGAVLLLTGTRRGSRVR
jgi:hypothetical protein